MHESETVNPGIISSTQPDISKIFVNYLRNSRQLICSICQLNIKPPTLDGFRQHVQNSAENHPTEDRAILEAFQKMKLSSSKPQPNPTPTTENDPQSRRSRKRSGGAAALDQPNNQQTLDHNHLNVKEYSDNNGPNKKIFSPRNGPPPTTSTSAPNRRGRGRQQADNNHIKEFDRGTKGSSTRQLWSPSIRSPQSSPQLKAQSLGHRSRPLLHANPAEHKMEDPDDSYVEDPSISQLIRQPETRPIYQEQLVAEVKGIYAGLVMIESKCIAFVDAADKEHYVPGTVNGTVVEALADTGAGGCCISSKLASHLGLRPVRGTQQGIKLATNKIVKSPGMVEVPWKFAGEQKSYKITCWIIPGCIHDLALGNKFLKATQTLKEFRSRIKSKLRWASSRLSLSFLGDEKQRLRGYLNGHLTAALPDTGSDAMFINGSYARKLGLDVDSDVRNLAEVQLADGSIIMTSGIVRDVYWKVGKTTVRCNFYVLEDLCADIILSNNYLFDMNIFSEQEEHFFDIDSEDHFQDYLFHFCNLRLVKKKRVASPSAFSPEMTKQELELLEQWEKLEELHKRYENRHKIMWLPEDEQEKAAQDEKARQQCWEALRKERKAKWAAASHTTKKSVQNGASLIGRLKKRLGIGVAPRKVAT